jgi:hypothetical protein
MVSNVELVSVNSAGPLDDHAAATLVRWTDLRLNWFPYEGLAHHGCGGGGSGAGATGSEVGDR